MISISDSKPMSTIVSPSLLPVVCCWSQGFVQLLFGQQAGFDQNIAKFFHVRQVSLFQCIILDV